MSEKMLTFIAPCYNGEDYVGRFLDSILSQTYNNIELIVINDGSKDNTEKILLDYEERFKKRGYRYIHFYQENQGMGAAINNALKMVTGEYFTWFGSDDYAHEDYAFETVSFLEKHQQYAVLRCEGKYVDENDINKDLGLFSQGNNDKYNEHLFENAILEKNFHFGYSVVRTSVFDKVNPKREIYPSRQGQNWQLLLPIFYENLSAFYDRPLYSVVKNIDSVSRTPNRKYDTAIAQKNEYEKILLTTLKSMNISEYDYYERMVKEKYYRIKMCIAITFGEYPDAIIEYKNLKSIRRNTFKDFLRFLRARFPIVDKLIKKSR